MQRRNNCEFNAVLYTNDLSIASANWFNNDSCYKIYYKRLVKNSQDYINVSSTVTGYSIYLYAKEGREIWGSFILYK